MITRYDSFFVDGRFIESQSGKYESIVSPSTEEEIGHVPLVTGEEMDKAVLAARRAFDEGDWPQTSPKERAALLRELADALDRRSGDIGDLSVDETGFPVRTSREAMEQMPGGALRHYADVAENFAFEETRSGGGFSSLVVGEPVGVVVAISPYNGPLQLAAQKIGAALAAGCTVVLKPPNQDPLGCYILAEELEKLGAPAGLVNIAVGDAETSRALVRNPMVDAVSFTGSTAVGKQIAQVCAADMRRFVMELGGKSPAVLLDDVDMDAVTDWLIALSFAMDSGQVCAMQSRFLVPRARYDEINEVLASAVQKLTVGDPWSPATDVGPMISETHKARVEKYVALGLDEGATLAASASHDGLDRGWYTSPAFLTNVSNDMRVAQEEIFGPVVVSISYDTEVEAIQLANSTPYGLTGTVWTADDDRGMRVARHLRAGTVGVNEFAVDAKAPFGGYRESGMGREMGHEGLGEFLELKAITRTDGDS